MDITTLDDVETYGEYEGEDWDEYGRQNPRKSSFQRPFKFAESKYTSLEQYKMAPRTKIDKWGDGSLSDLLSMKTQDTGPVVIEHLVSKLCHGKKFGKDNFTTDEYMKLQKSEDMEEIVSTMQSIDTLAPFKLRRVYGRLENVAAVNLTGVYKNHIAYASSNVVIILDFMTNSQHCLQGHRNTITCLVLEERGRFLCSTDSGKKSLIIVWDTMTGRPLKYFPGGHNNQGSIFACFTGVDFILASIGAEDMSKQTISFWSFDSKHPHKKTPILTENFPRTTSIIRELTFLESRREFFTATGDRDIIFGTWIRDKNRGDHVHFHKPRLRKKFIAKHKRFTTSLWMKNGEWLVTATGAGYACVWGPPVVLALEDPPDPRLNVREFTRCYKLCEEGITVFTKIKDYVVVGDEAGIVRFYDQDFKILRWAKHFSLPSIKSLSFNRFHETPEFKKELQSSVPKISDDDPRRRVGKSLVKDYTKSGNKVRHASMTTIPRPPMDCPDFVFAVQGGDVFYYHFNEGQVDRLVPGTPGPFVACDINPTSHHVIFVTQKGDVQVYDYKQHKLIFSDRIFNPNHNVSTLKTHPLGQFVSFGLEDGRIAFRKTYTFKTAIHPVGETKAHIVKIIFSSDGLYMAYFDRSRIISVFKYLPKGKGWLSLGRSRAHTSDVIDLQFFDDPGSSQARLFSVGTDKRLIEYDIDRSMDEAGLFIVKIARLEDTCVPTALVFNGPPEFGKDCVTFSNDINKLRTFSYEEMKVKATCCGPVFGREKGIQRMILFPAKMSESRRKNFIVYVVRNKLGMMDTPLDGNPHKFMAVYTHPREILDVALVPEELTIFTVGAFDNAVFEWEVSPRAVEATVLMGGSGVAPYYHTLKRHWGGACQDIIKDLDMIFFFLNVKRLNRQPDMYTMSRNIRLCEMSAVCRACGFYPSEYEVELMLDEARRMKQAKQHYSDDYQTEITFEEFIKLFVNHFYRVIDEDVEEAFKYLGFKDEGEKDPYICRHDFIKRLTEEGEKITPHNFPVYFEPIYGIQNPGVFGKVKCHTKALDSDPTVASESSSFSASDKDLGLELTSTSATSSTGEMDEELEGENDEDVEEEEEEEEEEEQEGEVEAEKSTTNVPEDSEDRYTEMDGEEVEEEESKESVFKQPDKVEEPKEEEEEDKPLDAKDDDLYDLPERIDLSFFVEKMIPTNCQQTIQWKKKPISKEYEEEEERKKKAKRRKAREEEFLTTILKQIIDPHYPIPKKLLSTLYAQFYLEQGNFNIPDEIRFPEVPLPSDSWYDGLDDDDFGRFRGSKPTGSESEDEEEEDEDEHKYSLRKAYLEYAGEYPEVHGEFEFFEDPFSKVPTHVDVEEYEGEGEDHESEPWDFANLEDHLDYEEYAGEEGEMNLRILNSQPLPAVPNATEDEAEEEELEEEEEEAGEVEEEALFSPPFSAVSTEGGGGFGRSLVSDGDGTEEMTDLENIYEEEEIEFVREMNKKSFTKDKPPPEQID